MLPEDVVWKPPSRYDHPAWTEEMLRSWLKWLRTVEELHVVWRVCAEYISPELTGKPALTALGVLSRRVNTAAREL